MTQKENMNDYRKTEFTSDHKNINEICIEGEFSFQELVNTIHRKHIKDLKRPKEDII